VPKLDGKRFSCFSVCVLHQCAFAEGSTKFKCGAVLTITCQDLIGERKTRKTVFILVAGLLLAIQFLSLAKASPSQYVRDMAPQRPPVFIPPLPPSDEPPAIPDSPFIENVASKYSYLIMLTEAYCSSPGNCNWNPKADLNCDNVVDIYDAVIVSRIH
jgi:hypothetical protein